VELRLAHRNNHLDLREMHRASQRNLRQTKKGQIMAKRYIPKPTSKSRRLVREIEMLENGIEHMGQVLLHMPLTKLEKRNHYEILDELREDLGSAQKELARQKTFFCG
jgi:hypothetical protein